jgi:thiamine biosynthesis lipoprotein
MVTMDKAKVMAPVENGTAEELRRFVYSQVHMGGRVDVTLYAASEDTAEQAARAAFARYAALEDVFSDYRPSSELMRLCAAGAEVPVAVSQELWDVLLFATRVFEASEGAFDVTAGPVVRLWRTARQTGALPDPDALASARARVGGSEVLLSKPRTVTLLREGMQLDLGGIAKGYANDAAIAVLREHGVGRAMVEAGGDISLSGAPPQAQGWMVRVRGLPDTLVVHDCAVSTSGDTEQFLEVGGVRYSHVVDPRTGLGVTTRTQATVVSPVGMASDACATALCIQPSLESVLEDFASAEALVTVVE